MDWRLSIILLGISCFTYAKEEGAATADFAKTNEANYKEASTPEPNANTSSVEHQGPADSHEAMNNRMQIAREKRSYEFLIGLVNNNSRYEVTRAKSVVATTGAPVDTDTDVDTDEEGDATAGDALLELMVKLAAHPRRWEKVHNLLQKLDTDLTTSKKIVEDIESSEQHPQNIPSTTDKRHHHHQVSHNPIDAQKTNDTKKGRDVTNEWPSFKPETDTGHKVNFAPGPHRNFKYRIVTDPAPLHKLEPQQQQQQQQQPRAYIAVSLIAPKDIDGDDDIVLEDELRRLKPWRENEDPYESLRWSKRDER